jgi:UDP-glucose 4-epimerase
MQIIITGVAGFVGSNLAKSLLAQGHQVVGIDNFSYGERRNIAAFLDNPNFSFFERDARQLACFDGLNGQILVHLASQKIPRYSNAYRTIAENSDMTKNVVAKCLQDNIKLVFASTSDIYGKNPELPYHENSNSVLGSTTVKRWAYATSKIHSEHYIIGSGEEFGLNYTIMRFFGSYGYNQNLTWWGGPQSVFIQNIIQKLPIEIHGDGQQTRTFTFINDTIQGVEKCMFHPSADRDIFNIASEPTEEISIWGLAELISELMQNLGFKPELKLIPYSSFGKYEDVMRRVPDIDKIKNMLGYQPQFQLHKGLKETINWQLDLHSKNL